jgi:hypothetical protein
MPGRWHGRGFFPGSVELADFGVAPIEDARSIGKIKVAVRFLANLREYLALFVCELFHWVLGAAF